MKVQKAHNWSGFEFFDFNNSDVLAIISQNDKIVKWKRVGANAYPELGKVASIQARNAGKTSLLQNNKSKVARYNTIHVVKLGSP